ncbi:MAG: hypothetical protein E7158_03745 [Firmicutes bacterium]|nr:hypothetical protein [Bacillota bacterium]
MEKEDINALDEIHKGACMGIDAIDVIIDKVEDKKFIQELKREYKNYQEIQKKIESVYPKYDDGEPHETSGLNKMMTTMNIDMKTMNDTSNSKIAELLLKGVNMGIIEGRRILNKKEINEEVNKIVEDYVNMQEESVEILKEYL